MAASEELKIEELLDLLPKVPEKKEKRMSDSSLWLEMSVDLYLAVARIKKKAGIPYYLIVFRDVYMQTATKLATLIRLRGYSAKVCRTLCSSMVGLRIDYNDDDNFTACSFVVPDTETIWNVLA